VEKRTLASQAGTSKCCFIFLVWCEDSKNSIVLYFFIIFIINVMFTGVEQVGTWFVNARVRTLPKLLGIKKQKTTR
jgi:hypothetical protein